MKKIFTLALLFCCLLSKAQTFSWNGYSPIISNIMDTLYIPVSGLPNSINQDFGLSKVCFEVRHTDKTNLNLILVAPNGNSVILVEGQGAAGENFIGTCVGMDGIPFQAGIPPYTGTFLPTGNLSNFNSGANPNGNWLLISFDNSPDTGSIRFASLTFSNDPPQGNGLGGSNLGPQGPFIKSGLVCPGGASGCELLPDVTASALEIQTSWVETPGRIEVGNSTPNIGYGPLEIFGIDSCFCNGQPAPCNVACPGVSDLKHIIRQRIYRKIPGTDTLGFYDRDAGQMTFHPEHGHLHVDHWADFTLRTATADPDPRNWPIIGTSVKQSYCLINLASCPNRAGICVDNNGINITNFPNYNFGFQSGCGQNQGIFPGKYDIYGRSLNEPILLDNVCNGNYYIVSITDPNNIFLESDETNNVAVVPITLTRQNPPQTITANATAEICQGDSIILTAGEALNYLWSTGDTSRSIIVREAGTYTVSSTCGTFTSTSQPYTTNLIPASAKADVSIAISSGSNPSCAGTPITFTATTVYGGVSPTYQWKVNGVNVGANSATYISSSLTNEQMVTCVITSSISCLQNPLDTSNAITINVTPVGLTPSVSIAIVEGANPQCLGDTIAFKATTQSATNISYQWKVDGVNVGSNSDTFSATTLTNGQTVTCHITSIPVCPVKYTLGNGTTTNSTNSVLGAAYPTYYGNGRQQYLIRAQELTALGISAGNISSVGFRTAGAVGDPFSLNGYTIKMASTGVNQLTNSFETASFTTVYGPVNYIPAINAINTHYFNQPFNWDGVSNIIIEICFANGVFGNDSYQTYVTSTSFISTAYYRRDNAEGAGACTETTVSAINNVRPNFIFGSNELNEMISNPVKMSVNSANPPSLSVDITTGDNPQCSGSTVTFTATPNSTGTGPSYQWIKNNIDINGATNQTYTVTNLLQNDTIRCRMVTGSICTISQNVLSNKFGVNIALPVYTFTGSGNWNVAANWLNGKMPPAKLLSCSEIVVSPTGSTESLLNIPQVLAPGAKLTIMAGKKFRVIGSMLIQQ
ncbi:MAG: hypothetical protein V4685_05900 [Bacteroidota bacterium]